MRISSVACLIWIPAVFAGCKEKDVNSAKVRIRSSTQPNSVVKISSYEALDLVTLFESETDSTGTSTFEIRLLRPLFANIQIGDKYGEVYLAPGDNLNIFEVGQKYTIPLRFSGRGAGVNNYISWINSNVEAVKWANGKGLYGLSNDEFDYRFDSLKNVIDDFDRRYRDSVSLKSNEIAMLDYKNRIKLLAVREEFKSYKMNNLLNQKWEARKNGDMYVDVGTVPASNNYSTEIPFDADLLLDGYADYRILLHFYWRNAISMRVSEDVLISDAPHDLLPLMTNALIERGDYPESIREFLIAFDLQQWLALDGITPATDSVYINFKTKYRESTYLHSLKKIYDEWLALAPGKPAPDLVGITTEGDTVSIRDFKGIIVYVDVWATWCGPCIAEIPASKKLQEKFLNEKEVQFLNVSVDNNRADWEKFLNSNKEWKGAHVIVEPDKINALYADYKLTGVPSYMLVDQAGNIVNVKAPPHLRQKLKTR